MKRSLLFIFLASFIIFVSCHKTSLPYYPVDVTIKTSFDFKPGTYWIYRDSISGREDSFFVTANTESTTSGNTAKALGYSVEYIDIAITEYNILPATAATDTGYWKFHYVGNEMNLYYAEPKIYTDSIFYHPLLDYPFEAGFKVSPGESANAYTDTGTIVSINGSLTLNGQSYTNVAEVNHKAYITANGSLPYAYSYNDWFYVCANVGMIKIVQNHPQDGIYRVWELQRYSIKN